MAARRLAEHLRRRHADVMVRLPDRACAVGALGDEELGSLVARSIELARSYGFRREADVGAFTVLRFVVAPNFHEQAPAAAVLRNPLVPVEDRIERLWRYTNDDDWDAIAAASDPAGW